MEEYKSNEEHKEENQNESSMPMMEQKSEDSMMESKKETVDQKQDRKIKNLIAVVIVLAALFVGSLFVDIAQLVSGKGYSERILGQTDIFEGAGKTWVAYDEPVVDIKVINDSECEACDPGEVLTFLRRIMPTIAVTQIDWQSNEGKNLQEKFNLQSLPAFVVSSSVEDTSFFAQAQPLFTREGDEGDYYFNVTELGAQPGRFIATPQIEEGDITIGSAEPKASVILFSDFQCPYSKLFYESTFKQALNEYSSDVQFAYKHLPLSFHPQARNAALASECAQEQGKFLGYADKLYAQQETWGQTTGTGAFKTMASGLGMNLQQFNTCLDGEKYAGKVDADAADAASFGISGTPSTFIGDDFQSGAISYDILKSSIDSELGIEEVPAE